MQPQLIQENRADNICPNLKRNAGGATAKFVSRVQGGGSAPANFEIQSFRVKTEENSKTNKPEVVGDGLTKQYLYIHSQPSDYTARACRQEPRAASH